MTRAVALIALTLLLGTGCYKATVETGLTPSAVTIDRPFAASWIYGLVPPSTINAAGACPGGVARVETQLSFVNQLVSALTLGIYTPMHIRVTCAQGSAGMSLIAPPGEAIAQVLQRAATMAVKHGTPVDVQF